MRSLALCASVHSMPLSISRSLNKNVYESLDHSSGLFGRNLDESLTPEGEERQAAEMKKQAAEAATQKSQQEYDDAFSLLGNSRPAPAPVERPATQGREKYCTMPAMSSVVLLLHAPAAPGRAPPLRAPQKALARMHLNQPLIKGFGFTTM